MASISALWHPHNSPSHDHVPRAASSLAWPLLPCSGCPHAAPCGGPAHARRGGHERDLPRRRIDRASRSARARSRVDDRGKRTDRRRRQPAITAAHREGHGCQRRGDRGGRGGLGHSIGRRQPLGNDGRHRHARPRRRQLHSGTDRRIAARHGDRDGRGSGTGRLRRERRRRRSGRAGRDQRRWTARDRRAGPVPAPGDRNARPVRQPDLRHGRHLVRDRRRGQSVRLVLGHRPAGTRERHLDARSRVGDRR